MYVACASRRWFITINALRPRRNEQHFADDIFKRIFLNENVLISIKISLKFVPKGPINNIPALVQIMAWRRPGDKPLPEPMMVSLPTHICVTRPQWVKTMVRFMPPPPKKKKKKKKMLVKGVIRWYIFHGWRFTKQMSYETLTSNHEIFAAMPSHIFVYICRKCQDYIYVNESTKVLC